MARFTRTLRTVLISTILPAAATPAIAQTVEQPVTQPPANQPPIDQPVTPAAPAQVPVQPRAAQPQQPASGARAELAQANENLAAVTRKLQAEADASPELVDARKNVDTTKAAYDDARAKAIGTLANNPDYRAAKSAADAARRHMNELAAGGNATPDARLAAATAALNAKAALDRIQNQALDADPAVAPARTAYEQAAASLAKLRQQNATFAQNPEWASAHEAVESARAKVAAETQQQRTAPQPAAYQQQPPNQPQRQQPQQPPVAPTPIHPTPQPQVPQS